MADRRLNQLLAIERAAARAANQRVTDAYKNLQRAQLFNGQLREYQPLADDPAPEDLLPPEHQAIQLRVADQLDVIRNAYEEMADHALTKDTANTVAVADVTDDDDQVLLAACPVSFLLWLEKQLREISSEIAVCPVLDPAVEWHRDGSTGEWVTDPTTTNRTRKVPVNHVLAPATDKHPAQVNVYERDEVVGRWTTQRTSTALPQHVKRQLADDCARVTRWVVEARERANMRTVIDRSGELNTLLNLVFGAAGAA